MGVGRGAPRTNERIGALADEPDLYFFLQHLVVKRPEHTHVPKLGCLSEGRGPRAEACLSCLRPLLLLLLLLLAAV